MEEEYNMYIYPNPSSGGFTLEFISNGIIDIYITNLLGDKILSHSLNTNGNHNMDLDLSKYPKGIYNLFVNTNFRIYSEKLILH